MTILELENRTGLDRSTIRYYEKEGLIAPSRKENSYRDYSEENAAEILKIKLLRQLDVSVDTIRDLQQGSADMSSVLLKKSQNLTAQIYQRELAAEICKEISDKHESYGNLQAQIYLDKLSAPPVPRTETEKEPPVKDTNWHLYSSEYHPFKRYIARLLDYTLLNLLFRFLLIVVLRVRPFTDFLANVVTYGSLLLSVPLYAWFLHRFATTPGKWLMGIHLSGQNGLNLTWSDAALREWKALLYGYGLGLPVLSLICQVCCFVKYRKGENLKQDAGVEHLYDTHKSPAKRAVFALTCGLLVFLSVFVGMDGMKPKYRGNDLSIAEFAENYNFYSYVVSNERILPSSKDPMNADGTWREDKLNENTNTIIISTAKGPKVDYVFELEGERLRTISYTNEWTEVQLWSMPEHLLIAATTAILSQEDTGYFDLKEILTDLCNELQEEQGEITQGNITIRWKIEAVGCVGSHGTYFATGDEKNTSLKLHFEIEIQ